MNDLSFVRPSVESVAAYGEFIDSLFRQNDSKEQESASLDRLRDRLLPQLLFGELSVLAAAAATEEAVA